MRLRMTTLLLAWTLVVSGTISPPAVRAAPPPNIVVVMLDDLDDQSFQTMLALGVLPNIQRDVVAHAVRFSNSFATNAVCAPSRSTYLTGRYSHNHGVLRNTA